MITTGSKRLLAIVAVALAAAACTVPGLPPAPPPQSAIHTGLGFDACAVQPNTNAVATLQAWLASPYRAVGLYLGGRSAGCQTTWNASTVNAVRSMGWRIIPIWVDLQAPCSVWSKKLSFDVNAAAGEGVHAADAAVARMQALGLAGSFAPIYLDVEAYNNVPDCNWTASTASVRAYVSGWTERLHQLSYTSGIYSSLASGIYDQSLTYHNPGYHRVDAVWFAAWQDPPNSQLFPTCSNCKTWLPDNLWVSHQRLRQYWGPHDETYGGVTMEIDSDNLDGPVVG